MLIPWRDFSGQPLNQQYYLSDWKLINEINIIRGFFQNTDLFWKICAVIFSFIIISIYNFTYCCSCNSGVTNKKELKTNHAYFCMIPSFSETWNLSNLWKYFDIKLNLASRQNSMSHNSGYLIGNQNEKIANLWKKDKKTNEQKQMQTKCQEILSVNSKKQNKTNKKPKQIKKTCKQYTDTNKWEGSG